MLELFAAGWSTKEVAARLVELRFFAGLTQAEAAEQLGISRSTADPTERAAFLAQACGGDRELRSEVERLLAAHQQAGDFLETPVYPTAEATGGSGPDKTEALPESDLPIEHAGARIGRYRLLEEIGEGAFGVVYMAEQLEPVQRGVALKIIKAGMETREVIAPLRHQAMVVHVAFSGDGRRFVSSSRDGTAKLWDIRTGELVRTYADGSGFVMASLFSPDGRQLLLRHLRGPVRLWSTEPGDEDLDEGLNSPTIVGAWSRGDALPASCPLLHGARPASACFHPDGQRVLTACTDGSVRLWDMTPDGFRFWPWSDQPRTILSTSASGHRAVTELASGALEI